MNVFDKIYQTDTWGFGSGHGSLPSVTKTYRAFLEQFLRTNDIESVVDYGCGDWQFSQLVDWGSANYTGIDVAENVIKENSKKHNRDNVAFLHVPFGSSNIPKADLIIVKDVLQHLSDDDVKSFLKNILPQFKFALITNCVEPSDDINKPIASGEFRPLDISKAPFNIQAATVHAFTGPRVFSKSTRSFFPAWKKHVQLVQL